MLVPLLFSGAHVSFDFEDLRDRLAKNVLYFLQAFLNRSMAVSGELSAR